MTAARVGRYRWVICGLLFAATVINYVDRQMIGILKPDISAEFGWSDGDYADIVFWFQAAYALGYVSFGWVVDRIGARLGYALAFVVWTLAHIAHGAAAGAAQFAMARFALGLGESGNFPSAVKAVTEWFPARERALATGIFNAGANVGAIITPLLVAAIVISFDWRWAFYLTGIASFVWLAAWLIIYRRPRETTALSPGELAHIESDPIEAGARIPWIELLGHRATWAYATAKFLTDPVWWLFLFWLPDFLAKSYGLDLKSFGPPLVAIYLLSDVGSVAGGYASSALMRRGWSVNAARKVTMLVCAIMVTPLAFAQYFSNLWVAVAVIGLAAAAHQAWSANLITLPSDLFPRSAVGSVIGIGGTAGAIGGMLTAKFIGAVLDATGSYASIFAVAASAYLVALAILHLLMPRMARVTA